MNAYKPSAISELESVDDTLRGLCTTIQIMRAGTDGMANGEYIADVLAHIHKSLQNARAELDEATSAVMAMRTSA